MDLEEIASYVVDVVRDELRDQAMPLDWNTALQDLDGFDSLLVVGLIERLESRFNVEIDPALILPETFESPLTIAAAVLRSRG